MLYVNGPFLSFLTKSGWEHGVWEQHLKASLPGKVGGECCQRDCHQVTLEGQRTAEPSLLCSSVSSGLGKKWPGGGDRQPTSGFSEDGNKSLFPNISFIRVQSRLVASRTTYCALCFVQSAVWTPPARASLAPSRWSCQTHRYRRGEEGLVTKEGGEVTMNRFRKWLYKPKVSYLGFTRCVSSAVSHFLCIALEIASKTADEWGSPARSLHTHLLTLACSWCYTVLTSS